MLFVAVMIWHCCYRTKTFEVCDLRIYQSENKFSPYTQCTHAVALNNKNTGTYIFSAVKFHNSSVELHSVYTHSTQKQRNVVCCY